MGIVIKGGKIVDPASNIEDKLDILIDKDKIVRIAKSIKKDSHNVLNAKGKTLIPGLIDMHTHLRQPGKEDAETIASGLAAAAKGGFTGVSPMPNTQPAIDSRSGVEFLLSEAKRLRLIDVYPIAAITKGREGKELTDAADLAAAGAVALSDDGCSVKDSHLMRRALEQAKASGLFITPHCEDTSLFNNGVMNEGRMARFLGLRGIPAESEAIIVARDIMLSEVTQARIHIAHVSSVLSIAVIKEAKKRGALVSCETCPHYFSLTEEAVKGLDTNTKINPPLRSREDMEAIKEALADGTIDVVATDHAPHTEAEKNVEFRQAPFGIIGLETALSLGITKLVKEKVLTLKQLIEKLSSNPSRILGLKNKGSIAPGKDADVVVIDEDKEWIVKDTDFVSKSKNSPFIGWTLIGAVETTISRGRIVYQNLTPRRCK